VEEFEFGGDEEMVLFFLDFWRDPKCKGILAELVRWGFFVVILVVEQVDVWLVSAEPVVVDVFRFWEILHY
jgi:hypothetical protein